jgi:hypothetical protein
LALNSPEGRCGQCLFLEIDDDDLLNYCVVTMLGLYDRAVLRAVGEKREVTPVGPQLGLRPDQPGAAGD